MDRTSTTAAPAGIFRRLAALLYDLLLAGALAAAATFALLPLTDGEAILVTSQGFGGHLYHAALLVLVFAYFGLGWTRSGQTLGMKAWRIRLVAWNGRGVTWADAAVRFTIGATIALLAIAGVWQLIKPGRALADVIAMLSFLPAVTNLAWIRIAPGARSFQDLAGGLRMTRA
jgi:uncharacterized RDD family membrane protein YckC